MAHPSGASYKHEPAWLDRMKHAEGGSADAKTIGNDGRWDEKAARRAVGMRPGDPVFDEAVLTPQMRRALDTSGPTTATEEFATSPERFRGPPLTKD